MKPQERRTLQLFFPAAHYHLEEVTTKEQIAMYYASRMAMCWGNGPIKDTNFYKLCQTSPQHKGDKQLILVCRQSAIAQAEGGTKP